MIGKNLGCKITVKCTKCAKDGSCEHCHGARVVQYDLHEKFLSGHLDKPINMHEECKKVQDDTVAEAEKPKPEPKPKEHKKFKYELKKELEVQNGAR